jgi:L-malate glycosyltransferase
VRAQDLRIGLVGPLPPPSGGMANQTRQLARLLEEEGMVVELIQTNAPYWPQWVSPLRGIRAVFRLVPYMFRLWRVAGRVRLFHVMANSGWSWHLVAAPAVWTARLRRIPVVVNYRGGGAEAFLDRSISWVGPTLRLADRVIVPSAFLQHLFRRFNLSADVVPNVIDLNRFSPGPAVPGSCAAAPHLIVTRNLEPVYDVSTALRTLALVLKSRPGARMTVAGSGPERNRLAALAQSLGVAAHVTFAGDLDTERMAGLYQGADVFINPSLVDNMPNSVLEALASGVPVVSTNVGGVPFIVEHRKSAMLVPPGDVKAMASAVLELLDDPAASARLVGAGRNSVQQYSWRHVRGMLLDLYYALVDQDAKWRFA